MSKLSIDKRVADSAAVLITAQVTNKALTSNVVTLTTDVAHGLVVNDRVTVAGVGAPFDGTYVVASTPSGTTFTYAKTNANVTSAAATGTLAKVPTYRLVTFRGGRREQRVTLLNKGPGIIAYDTDDPGILSDPLATGLTLASGSSVQLYVSSLYISTDTDATDIRYLSEN